MGKKILFLLKVLILYLYMLVFLVVILLAKFGLSVLPEKEVQALKDLYRTTEGEKWTHNSNWLKGDPCQNNWYGIQCTSDGSHVRNLQLSGNNLGGYLPKNLGDLTKLYMVGLDIMPNHIGGDIPESLGNCTEMVLLTLEQQKMTGVVPESFNKLKNLMVLHLGANQLTSFPNLGDMGGGTMQSFVLSNNNMNGVSIPDKGPSAYQCDLSGNNFKCPIPSWAKDCNAKCS